MSTTVEIAPGPDLGSLKKQPATAVIGYGLGDFANNLAFSMGTSFLLYYLTDVAGVTAAAVGTMFLAYGSGTRSPTSSPAAWSTAR